MKALCKCQSERVCFSVCQRRPAWGPSSTLLQAEERTAGRCRTAVPSGKGASYPGLEALVFLASLVREGGSWLGGRGISGGFWLLRGAGLQAGPTLWSMVLSLGKLVSSFSSVAPLSCPYSLSLPGSQEVPNGPKQ